MPVPAPPLPSFGSLGERAITIPLKQISQVIYVWAYQVWKTLRKTVSISNLKQEQMAEKETTILSLFYAISCMCLIH